LFEAKIHWKKKKVMIISNLDILEVIPEANQVKVNGSGASAIARAKAFGRLTSIYTWKRTITNSDSSSSTSSSSSSASS
jgi:hypothetical protein